MISSHVSLNCERPIWDVDRFAPLAPWIIRWGAEASSDMLRRSALRARCGHKGAKLATDAQSGHRLEKAGQRGSEHEPSSGGSPRASRAHGVVSTLPRSVFLESITDTSPSGASAMDLGLQGKRAIVTGGSRGIGKAIARELAREGVDVAIVARSGSDLAATAKELAAETNQRIVPLAADVTSREQVEKMVTEASRQMGSVDILVNSGSAPGGSATAIGPIETVVDEDLIQDFNIKYVGALRCSRAVLPLMKQQRWGRIINISGANARNAGNLSGGARNGAMVHMTKTLAVQFGRHGITVNCIHPGTTRTERTPRLLEARAAELGVSPQEAERRDFAPDSPRGNAICRMVDASEIAFLAVFLASEKAWAVSGELIAATGGAGRAVYY